MQQTDLLGQNILNYTHPDDHAFLKQQLIPKNLEKLFDSQLEDENGEPRTRTEDEEKEIDRKLKEDKRYFQIRYKIEIIKWIRSVLLYFIVFYCFI